MTVGHAAREVREGVPRCLDTGRLNERFNALVSWPRDRRVAGVRVRRFMPARNGKLEIEYDIELESGRDRRCEVLYGRYPALRETGAEPGSSPEVSSYGLSGLFLHDDELNMTFHTMDRDPVLPQVVACLDPLAMSARLAAVGAWTLDAGDSLLGPFLQCRPVAYRRGRRFVIYYRGRGLTSSSLRGWAGKGYADDRGARIALWQKDLAGHLDRQTGARIRLPRFLGYDPELRMCISEWTASLPQAPGEQPESLALSAAHALAVLHQAPPPPGLMEFTSLDQVEILDRWVSTIRKFDPSCFGWAESVLDALRDRYSRMAAAPIAVIHRDFYESQLIPGRRSTTIVDLDTLAMGDPGVDVGNYLAHQWLLCLKQGFGPARYASIVEVFLRMYEAVGSPIDESALALHWASALFRLGAIHRFRAATSRYAPALWYLVLPVLERGRPTVLDPRGVGWAVDCDSTEVAP